MAYQRGGPAFNGLIEWEIQRARGLGNHYEVKGGRPLPKLQQEKWLLVRDTLADVWDWWGEGVHLRPQPKESFETGLEWEKPVAYGVVLTDRLLSEGFSLIRPTRITTIDSHLGDALFQLCCDVHRSFIDIPFTGGSACRRYQIIDDRTGGLQFYPGSESLYWEAYWHRIEAAGYRTRFRGQFPRGINLSHVNWNGENLYGHDLSQASLSEASLSETKLFGVFLGAANLQNAQLIGVYLAYAFLGYANLNGANIKEGLLFNAEFKEANLAEANLTEANLREANLTGANLTEANLREANLTGANLREANLTEAITKGAIGLRADIVENLTRKPRG